MSKKKLCVQGILTDSGSLCPQIMSYYAKAALISSDELEFSFLHGLDDFDVNVGSLEGRLKILKERGSTFAAWIGFDQFEKSLNEKLNDLTERLINQGVCVIRVGILSKREGLNPISPGVGLIDLFRRDAFEAWSDTRRFYEEWAKSQKLQPAR